jgi:hypothetical protein
MCRPDQLARASGSRPGRIATDLDRRRAEAARGGAWRSATCGSRRTTPTTPTPLVLNRCPAGTRSPRWVPLTWPLAEAGVWAPVGSRSRSLSDDGRPAGHRATVAGTQRDLRRGAWARGSRWRCRLPVAAAALDPDVDRTCATATRSEFRPRGPRARPGTVARRNMGQAVGGPGRAGGMRRGDFGIARFNAVLLGEGRRKIARRDGMRLIVIAVKRAGTRLHRDSARRKTAHRVRRPLRDLVARGRARRNHRPGRDHSWPSCDVVADLAAQTCSGSRWGGCAARLPTHPDHHISRARPGPRTASLVAATDVPAEARGVGYLLAEGGQPVRCQGRSTSTNDHDPRDQPPVGSVLRGRRPGPHGLAAMYRAPATARSGPNVPLAPGRSSGRPAVENGVCVRPVSVR